MADAQADRTSTPVNSHDVPGWFPPLDQMLFTWFLEQQKSGSAKGRSAGTRRLHGQERDPARPPPAQDGEAFTVCDLFEGEAPDGANRAETSKSYASLTRETFERNYLSFHDTLPTVITGPQFLGGSPGRWPRTAAASSTSTPRICTSTCTATSERPTRSCCPTGVVVLDDFRSEHTPGVSVAVWEAVLNRGLRADLPQHAEAVRRRGATPSRSRRNCWTMLRGRADVGLSVQEAAGHRLIRARAQKMKPPAFPRSRHYRGAGGRTGGRPRSPRRRRRLPRPPDRRWTCCRPWSPGRCGGPARRPTRLDRSETRTAPRSPRSPGRAPPRSAVS